MSRRGVSLPAPAPVALRGARPGAVGSNLKNGGELRFYPHADGSIDMPMWVGSDFRVMEDYLCRWIQPAGAHGSW